MKTQMDKWALFLVMVLLLFTFQMPVAYAKDVELGTFINKLVSSVAHLRQAILTRIQSMNDEPGNNVSTSTLSTQKEEQLLESLDELEIRTSRLSVLLQKESERLGPSESDVTCPNYYGAVLSIGDSGEEVNKLQDFLSSSNLGASVKVTGVFDVQTQQALQVYQAKEGIVSTGTPQTTGYGQLGPRTRLSIADQCA